MSIDTASQSSLIIGPLNAEREWIPEGQVSLHFGHSEKASGAIVEMEHLLVMQGRQNDLLLTLSDVDPIIDRYHQASGFGCEKKSLSYHQGDILDHHSKRSQSSRLGKMAGEWVLTNLGANHKFNPYAVTPFTISIASVACFNQSLPELNSVQKVNGKAWAVAVRRKLGLPEASAKVIRNGTELLLVGSALLSKGALIVKDSYGVGGGGSIVINNTSSLEVLARLIDRLSTQGCMELIVESFLAKTRDVSAQLIIERGGEVKMVGHCETYMDGRTPRAIRPITVTSEGAWSQFNAICMEVCGLAWSEGYWGPCCIDAMELNDGSMFPLVEINCRMSLGRLIMEAASTLGEGVSCNWILRRMRHKINRKWSSKEWLDLCRKSGFLYPEWNIITVIPLLLIDLVPTYDESMGYYEFWWIQGQHQNSSRDDGYMDESPWENILMHAIS
jgi:hypothetical protein